MNIKEDSTASLLELGSDAAIAEDHGAFTEIDKRKGFNLVRSIDSQMDLIEKIPSTPDTPSIPEKSVMEMEIDFINNNISNLAKAKLSFGFNDSQKPNDGKVTF